jgi:hypothetical protein
VKAANPAVNSLTETNNKNSRMENETSSLVFLIILVIPLMFIPLLLFAFFCGRCIANNIFRFTTYRLFPCFEDPLLEPNQKSKETTEESAISSIKEPTSSKGTQNVSDNVIAPLPPQPHPASAVISTPPPLSKFSFICQESDESWLGALCFYSIICFQQLNFISTVIPCK